MTNAVPEQPPALIGSHLFGRRLKMRFAKRKSKCRFYADNGVIASKDISVHRVECVTRHCALLMPPVRTLQAKSQGGKLS